MKAPLVAFVCALALAVTASAHAQTQGVARHRVASDDTIELLAAEYYGDRRHASFIRLANGIDEARGLHQGQRIRIPIGRRVVTEAGQDLEEIAAEHLGDKRRAEQLAEYNDRESVASLAAGELVRVPFHVEYTADEDVSLEVLAARHLRGSRDTERLRTYNFLDDDVESLEEGESILIPALHIGVRSSRLPTPGEEARERVKMRRTLQAEAESALPSARHAWRRGDYEAVERQLISLDIHFLDAETALEISILLGGTHIARGDDESAREVFRKALERDPDYEMSAYHYSPAIRTVWKKVGGPIDTSSR